MKLNAPPRVFFLIGLALTIAAIVGTVIPMIPFLSEAAAWFAIAGFLVLAAGCLCKVQ